MTERLTNILTELNDKKFVKELKEKGSVFLVGGIVRDSFLDKESKDIDLLVCGVELDDILTILKKHGKVDLVGDSFGVIKFNPVGWKLDEPIDIAIPRTEKSTGIGHKDFEVTASKDIPVEKDLERRDFTINAIAVNLNTGQIFDPFNGQKDIREKLIRKVSELSFIDDPLRMLRGVQFVSRFEDFNIEKETFISMFTNAHLIKTVTGERIREELEKIFFKGDIQVGFGTLIDTKLFENIFEDAPNVTNRHFDNVSFECIKTLGDFFFVLLRDFSSKSTVFKKVLKGDNNMAKHLDALQFGFDTCVFEEVENRLVAFDMFAKCSKTFESGLFPTHFAKAIGELKLGKFPKSRKELAIGGDDVKALGLKNEEVGVALRAALVEVMSERRTNTKKDLLDIK